MLTLAAKCSSRDDAEQLTKLHIALESADQEVGAHLVAVAPPDALARDVARVDQAPDDAVRSSLGDAHAVGDVAQAHAWILGDTEQREAVIREELPVGF